ncbi:hypothetical protein OS493_018162 [Desmophyllum pertusum]|uniref:Uncharacterized protein n=1 Tax=Desmophyllum pertusum TaxID=174260 RepID=A0A9X0CKJ8_9CNID|nr:hypothetical protein OS493_018162 [Desmophyllum pertusum]
MDVFVNLPTGFGKSLIYQALDAVGFQRDRNVHYGSYCCGRFSTGESDERPGGKSQEARYPCKSLERHIKRKTVGRLSRDIYLPNIELQRKKARSN